MKQAKLGIEDKSALSRSPRFPVYSLPKALEKVKMLYDSHKRNFVAAPVALTATGHKSGSSKGLQTLATLRYYGLIEITGLSNDKKVKVSDLAFRIFMDIRPNSTDRDQAIRTAALSPKMFKAIYDKYPEDLPGDDALHYELTVDYGFNENSVSDFIRAFKETITFAKIYKSDIIESDAEKPEELELPQKEDNMNTISDKQQLPKIPICTYGFTEEVLALFPTRPKLSFRILSIKGDTEVTQSDIDQLISYLNLYKKGFPIDESSKQ